QATTPNRRPSKLSADAVKRLVIALSSSSDFAVAAASSMYKVDHTPAESCERIDPDGCKYPRMLTFHSSRRDFLRLGGLAFGGLTLGDILRLRAMSSEARPTERKAIIFVYLFGGPSHVDTYDMKPDAPVEYRGEFQPGRTNVPGFHFCDL